MKTVELTRSGTGSDTTSTAFAACFFYLLHNPSCLERLSSEVRSLFADVEDIVLGPPLNPCRYLRACIDEAMRLAPPVPALLPREILSGGMTIDGHHFLEGTVVGVPTYAIHRKADYFPEPLAYKPERWLIDEKADKLVVTAENLALAQSAFCPFSIGPRGCIGKGVAYLELSVALARTLFLYDMRLANGQDVGRAPDGHYELSDIFVARKNGPIVQFRSRN